MIKLNKEQFIDEIVGKLKRIYGQENVQTSIQIKNNGVKFNAITIHRENRQLSPCVYIDKYYEKYKMGIMEIGDVVRKVVQKNEEKMGDDDFDISVLSDYDRACTRIRVRLINTEQNGELLLNVPHREFLDLSLIYYIDMTSDKNKDVSIFCTRICNSQMAKWKIKDLNGLEAQGEDWYLAIDMNKEYRENGTHPANGKLTEISFIQEDNHDRSAGIERTRESVEYKLEDITEPPLNAKEEKHMEQLRKKEINEANNTRKEHKQELQDVIERLTEKYGEGYRKEIEEKVEQEHRKGKDAKEIEHDVKEDMNDLEDELYRHGRRRDH